MKKYGRTSHLPISPGTTNDDKVMSSLERLMVDDLIITEKMDGENTTIHRLGMHARSPDSMYHPSRDWVKGFAASIAPQLETDERIVGENLFARHSLAYEELPSFFMGFAWIIDGEVQAWDTTLVKFAELGITPVRELYRGPFHECLLQKVAQQLDLSKQEGFVVRDAGKFDESAMPVCMGKYVRPDHVQSDVHWMNAELVPNRMAKN